MVELEDRYLVIKRTDFDEIDFYECNAGAELERLSRAGVFIEQDWPEYEPTKALLLARIELESAVSARYDLGMIRGVVLAAAEAIRATGDTRAASNILNAVGIEDTDLRQCPEADVRVLRTTLDGTFPMGYDAEYTSFTTSYNLHRCETEFTGFIPHMYGEPERVLVATVPGALSCDDLITAYWLRQIRENKEGANVNEPTSC